MSLQSLRKLCAAAGILVVAWLAYVYFQVPHEKKPFAHAAEKAEQINLSQGGREIALRRESGQWKVGQSTGPSYSADAEIIKTLLTGLGAVQLEDVITDRADRAADYDVTVDSGLRVRVVDAKQAILGEGIFGKQAPDFAHIYFRYSDKPDVFLARGLIRGDLGRADQNFWRSRQLIDIAEAKVQSIFIQGPGFKTDLVRISSDSWTLNGEPAESGYVNALIGTLAHSHLDEFIDPIAFPNLSDDKLSYAHVSVRGTGTSVDLLIGTPDPKSKRYPASIGKDHGLVWLSQGTIDSLLKKPADLKTKK
jgi:hypothetical protein